MAERRKRPVRSSPEKQPARIPLPARAGAKLKLGQADGPRVAPGLKIRRIAGPRIRAIRPAPVPGARAFDSERYKLISPAGRGGMGLVYRARDELLGMDVAIKFLPEGLLADDDARQRFKTEASIAMQLRHENIVTLHNLQVEGGRMFLVMEFVDGHDFRRIIDETPRLSLGTVADVALCCGAALDYAHGHGVLHKDLKPENVMLNAASVLKIVDFGTAFKMGSHVSEDDDYLEGTPAYMSPEQIMSRELDPRTDIYSLGVVLYEFLAGRPAFPLRAGAEDVLAMAIEPLRNFPTEVTDVLDRAIARDREDRWPSALEFCQALAQSAAPHLEQE